MKPIITAIALLTLSLCAIAETGVISHVDEELKFLTIVGEQGEPRTYFVTDKTRLRLQQSYGTTGLKAGNEAEFSYRQSNDGRELTDLSIQHPEIAQQLITYQARDERSISGEIVGKRRVGSSLVVKHDEGERRTFRIHPDAVIRKGKQIIAFNDLKKGDYITARYFQTHEGSFLVSSNDKPAIITPAPAVIPDEPVQVAAVAVNLLPATASPYPLLLMISLLAGGAAFAIRVYRK